MTKRELLAVNEDLCQTLLELRALIDEALAASDIDPDDENAEVGDEVEAED